MKELKLTRNALNALRSNDGYVGFISPFPYLSSCVYVVTVGVNVVL